ncbi:MAG: RimK family alpha-L-glutamate ligase [Clostridiales bacterium]|nr:RimK family alpha-L-glutamate ligase [Clostridiales bacterium]
MKGLILTNAYNTSPSYLNQSIRLKQELDKLKVAVDIRQNDFFPAIIADGGIKLLAKEYEFCVFLDKDKYVSRMLEDSGVRMFNTTDSMEICDDKMTTCIKLAKVASMPITLPGLLCYNSESYIKDHTIDKIKSNLSFPIVIKQAYGSLGKGVYKANNEKELKAIMEKVKLTPHLFQEFIKESYGKDVRVIVIGNKVCASMLRVSQGDFRSNAELGGKAYKYTLPHSYASLCEKVSKVLGLDYCGIDILIGKDDKPLICEVNSNAFWGKIEEVTNVNVAKAYAIHIIKSLS